MLNLGFATSSRLRSRWLSLAGVPTYALLLSALLIAYRTGMPGAVRADSPSNTEVTALQQELADCPFQILFESYVDNNWEIMRMHPDGSHVENLTQTPDIHELYPQASPDGKWICFLADIETAGTTERSVYVMRVDGTERTLVAKQSRDPCWNQASSKIAFVPQEFPKFNVTDYVSKGLSIYDLAQKQVTAAPASDKIEHLYNLCWSPDERWIISTVHGGMGFGHAIIAIDWKRGTIIDLKIGGCRPSLSGDGTHLTWSEDDHRVCCAKIEWHDAGPQVSDKRTVDERNGEHLYHPDLSPDAKYVTYSVGPGGRVPRNGPGTHTQLSEMIGVRGKWNLFLRRADGTGPAMPLTTDETRSNKESEWIRAAGSN